MPDLVHCRLALQVHIKFSVASSLFPGGKRYKKDIFKTLLVGYPLGSDIC